MTSRTNDDDDDGARGRGDRRGGRGHGADRGGGGRRHDGRRGVRPGRRAPIVRTGRRPARRTGPVRDDRALRDGGGRRRPGRVSPAAGDQAQTPVGRRPGVSEQRRAVPQRDTLLRTGAAVADGPRARRPGPVAVPVRVRPQRLRAPRVPGRDRAGKRVRPAAALPAVRAQAGLGLGSRGSGARHPGQVGEPRLRLFVPNVIRLSVIQTLSLGTGDTRFVA